MRLVKPVAQGIPAILRALPVNASFKNNELYLTLSNGVSMTIPHDLLVKITKKNTMNKAVVGEDGLVIFIDDTKVMYRQIIEQFVLKIIQP